MYIIPPEAVFPLLVYVTNAPIAVHCTRSLVNSSYSLTTGQCDSVPTIRVLGHSTCRMVRTVHAQITCLLA